MINPEMIESLREPGFARRAWGYDRYQVDSFLEELIERLERLQAESRALPEGAELSGVGRRVEEILTGARGAAAEVATAADQRAEGLRRESEEAAEKLRRESEEAASELKRGSEEAAEQQRREADEYARNTRSAADEYASSTRAEAEAEVAKLRELAEADAETKRAAAEEEAERILRNARLELGRVEESIEKLRERRALVIQSIEQMRGNLSSMVGEASRGTGEFVGVSTGNGSVENPEEEGTAVLDTEQPTGEGEWAAKTEEESAADAEEEFEGDYEDETLEQRRRVVFDDETDEQAIRTEDL